MSRLDMPLRMHDAEDSGVSWCEGLGTADRKSDRGQHLRRAFDPMSTTTTIGGRIAHWEWMRRSLERFSHPIWVWSESCQKWAVCITTMSDKPRECVARKAHSFNGYEFSGRTGATMLGSAAKSSRFFYYACHNYAKRGKSVCDAKLVNKKQLETFVIERIKAHILTEKNLQELVQLTNEEIKQSKEMYQERLIAIEGQIHYRTLFDSSVAI
jgi:hypothetical protein